MIDSFSWISRGNALWISFRHPSLSIICYDVLPFSTVLAHITVIITNNNNTSKQSQTNVKRD